MKRLLYPILLFLLCLLQSACITTAWTGASMIYDRHNVYKKMNDADLAIQVRKLLYPEIGPACRACNVDIAVFHGDVLLAGSVPSESLKNVIDEKMKQITGYRNLYLQVAVRDKPIRPYLDAWISGKIRAHIFTDDRIDPGLFKVVTVNQIVYLMGDLTREQADLVIDIARNRDDVIRVVTLFKYYELLNNKVHVK